jgi:isoquinoline 1-oxidoreductase subunit beta
MGQGVRTALPMILAEELEVDLENVTLAQARPGDEFPDLSTFGSRSVRLLWTPLRTAGAAAREMLIGAAAARWAVPPSECRAESGRVHHGSSGRVFSYGELVADAARQRAPRNPPLKKPSQFRIVGRDRTRFDLPRIVQGSAIFASDVRVPGMKFASVIRCPVNGGKLRSWDASAAKSVPGVRLVVPVTSGVAVIADDTFAAFSGRRAVEPTIVWEEGPHAAVSSEDMLARLREAAARGEGRALRRGARAETGLAAAARRLEAEYLYPFQAHAAMEPLVAVADARPDRCEIWAGSQSPNAARATAADVLGLPLSAVTLNVTLLGGGFGRRGQSDFVRDAAEASRAAGAPVQVVWTREDDLRHDYYHPISLHRMSAGLDAGGRIVAWRHQAIGPSAARSGRRPESGEQLRKDLRGAYDVPYDFAAVSAELVEAAAPVRIGFWRGVQHNSNVFASECFLDELAVSSGRDPLDFRLEHLKGGGEFPGGRDGAPVQRSRLARTVALVAEKSGWKGSAGGAGRGRGIACSVHDGGTYVAVVADVSVDHSGEWRADRVVAVADCGIAVNPLGARAQMEGGVAWALSALSSEITLSRGRVEQSSFGDFPILRLRETPSIETHLVRSEEAPTGMGEVVNPACLAAAANALSAATGRRLRRLPVRSEDLTGPGAVEPFP